MRLYSKIARLQAILANQQQAGVSTPVQYAGNTYTPIRVIPPPAMSPSAPVPEQSPAAASFSAPVPQTGDGSGYPPVFLQQMEDIFRREGGGKLHNVAGDAGGWTKWGVAQNANPDVDVANLTKEGALKIYYDRYWKASGADKITDPKLQAVHFDAAVNHGVGGAAESLKQSGNTAEGYLAARTQKYHNIVANNPSQKKFLNGWLNRIDDLRQSINSLSA